MFEVRNKSYIRTQFFKKLRRGEPHVEFPRDFMPLYKVNFISSKSKMKLYYLFTSIVSADLISWNRYKNNLLLANGQIATFTPTPGYWFQVIDHMCCAKLKKSVLLPGKIKFECGQHRRLVSKLPFSKCY